MNHKLEVHLKSIIKTYLKYAPDGWTIHDVLMHITHEWRAPINLSILLFLSPELREKYVVDNTPTTDPDDLMMLTTLRKAIVSFTHGYGIAEINDDMKLMYSFDIEVTGGIAGCAICNAQNQGRFRRAIRRCLGLWDGVVAPKTYHYIYRRLNKVIDEENQRRIELNKLLPANLQLPTL